MISKVKQDELYALLERVDELSITEGVDSDIYRETFDKLLLKQKEYGAFEEVPHDEDMEALVTHGGPGSGNFGHAGRPGQVGGSAPRTSSKGGESTKLDPLDINKDNLQEVWETLRDKILASDSKLSPVAAGNYAAARILNAVRERTKQFRDNIDKRIRDGEDITDDEDAMYTRIVDKEYSFQDQLVRLSGYRPYPDLDEHPLSKGDIHFSPKDYSPKVGHKITTMPVGDFGPMELKVQKVEGDKVGIGWADSDRVDTWMSKESYRQFLSDIEGKVDVPKSDNLHIEEVRQGKAKMLGRGDDGIVFKVGDSTVKVSSVVPNIPTNPGYRTPEQAVGMLRSQTEVSEKLRELGVPGMLPTKFVEHGGKGFQIRPYVEIPSKFTPEQLEQTTKIVKVMHEKGYSLNDEIQVGLKDGKVFMFDTGKASPLPPEEKRREDRIWYDNSALERFIYRQGNVFK